ncbi:MAG: class I SAM-dependent methyltransferase [Alphaproteobacteria bacterium]|nr:class I SAM-dependent methyltransferase [Alphaproteobacteria bacterium]
MQENADSLLDLGLSHLKANRALDAVETLEKLRCLAPDHPGLTEAYVKALRKDARHAQALSVAEAARPQTVQLMFERALSLLALGRAGESLAAFDAVLALDAHLAVAWYQSHGPALDLIGLDEAQRRIERALACTGANGNYRALLAAYHLLADHASEAKQIARKARHRVLIEGIEALRPFFAPGLRLFGVSAHLLDHALAQADLQGLVLEFGVRRGTSLSLIAQRARQAVHGFDSFEGLPESWGANPAGVLTTGAELPQLPSNACLHPGWFNDTLPAFLASHPDPVRFINIDSDIYASARTVLFALAPRLLPGCIVVFDELIGNPTWRDDEYKALMEAKAAFSLHFEIFALAPATKQVALRIL